MDRGLTFDPWVIGATGGSGTRVVARIVRECGVFMGENLNPAGDSLELSKFVDKWVPMYSGRSGDTPNRATMERDFEQAIGEHLAPFLDRSRPWGWKSPPSMYLVPFLHQQFPRLRFLHLVRDGRDMAFSVNQNQLRKYGPAILSEEENRWSLPVRSVALWSRANLQAAVYGEKTLKDCYRRIRFEDLCYEPVATVARILEFFELDGNVSALAELPSAPVSIGRWRDQDSDLLESVQEVGHEALRAFGYLE
jgi:hypothetical protein